MGPESPGGYRAMTLAELGGFMAGVVSEPSAGADAGRWRLVAEFLEEFSHEPADSRGALLVDEPAPSGDEKWDVFLAALAEHLAARDARGAPQWAYGRSLRAFWFPFDTPAARADAVVHAPASFRRRGIFVAPQELNVA